MMKVKDLLKLVEEMFHGVHKPVLVTIHFEDGEWEMYAYEIF